MDVHRSLYDQVFIDACLKQSTLASLLQLVSTVYSSTANKLPTFNVCFFLHLIFLFCICLLSEVIHSYPALIHTGCSSSILHEHVIHNECSFLPITRLMWREKYCCCGPRHSALSLHNCSSLKNTCLRGMKSFFAAGGSLQQAESCSNSIRLQNIPKSFSFTDEWPIVWSYGHYFANRRNTGLW
jgi:hypothetical protein